MLAGGAVASMCHPGTTPKDYDLFCVVPSEMGPAAAGDANAALMARYAQEDKRQKDGKAVVKVCGWGQH